MSSSPFALPSTDEQQDQPSQQPQPSQPARKPATRKKSAKPAVELMDAEVQAMELFSDNFALGSAFVLLWELGASKDKGTQTLEKIVRLVQAEIARR